MGSRSILILVVCLAAVAAPAAHAHPAEFRHGPLGSAGRLAPPTGPPTARRAPPDDYPRAVWRPASRKNYTVAGRPESDPVRRIVVHVAEGTYSGTIRWFENPRAQASAHYVVARDGRVAETVRERDIAWHAGNWPYNVTSIGIEHAGYTDRGGFTDRQYRRSARVAGFLVRRYGIPPNRRHVIGHDEVPDPFHHGSFGGADHHTDPGRHWRWSRYIGYLRFYADVTYRQVLDDRMRSRVRRSSAWHRIRRHDSFRRRALVATTTRRRSDPARFRFTVPATGWYSILMHWPCRDRLVRHARVSVMTTRGRRVRTVDEHRRCGRWNFVDTLPLAKGTGARVRLSRRSHDRGLVAADGVLIVDSRDRTPPTPPRRLEASAVGTTAVTLTWKPARDRVGVARYEVRLDGGSRRRTRQTSMTLSGLACGTAHEAEVKAQDTSGHRSLPARVAFTTAAC